MEQKLRENNVRVVWEGVRTITNHIAWTSTEGEGVKRVNDLGAIQTRKLFCENAHVLHRFGRDRKLNLQQWHPAAASQAAPADAAASSRGRCRCLLGDATACAASRDICRGIQECQQGCRGTSLLLHFLVNVKCAYGYSWFCG